MQLHRALARFDALIAGYEVLQCEFAGTNTRLRVRIDLRDGTRIFARQVVLAGREVKYAFHWQDAAGKLLVRWDNAPHWPDVATAPHHKHLGTSEKVEPSEATTLEEVLTVIARELENP